MNVPEIHRDGFIQESCLRSVIVQAIGGVSFLSNDGFHDKRRDAFLMRVIVDEPVILVPVEAIGSPILALVFFLSQQKQCSCDLPAHRSARISCGYPVVVRHADAVCLRQAQGGSQDTGCCDLGPRDLVASQTWISAPFEPDARGSSSGDLPSRYSITPRHLR